MNKLSSSAMMSLLSMSISACSIAQPGSPLGAASCSQKIENSPAIQQCTQPRLGWKGADGSAYQIGG